MQTAVLLRLSLVGNLETPFMPPSGTEWRERGYGLWLPWVRYGNAYPDLGAMDLMKVNI